MSAHIEQLFQQAIAAAGLTPPSCIVADGGIHRFATNGKRGDKSGWYCLHADGVAAGSFGCWRAGIESSWCSKADSALSATERAINKARMKAAMEARHAEQLAAHQQAAGVALHRWQAATPAPVEHPYLARKGIAAHGVRVDNTGNLLVPMRDTAGTLHSLQYINATGDKKFMAGGRVTGCYAAIGVPDGCIVVCEGFATGASIHQATGHAVAVAFSAGNLEHVAKALHQKHPGLELVLAADDDWATPGNPGLSSAKQAALAVSGQVVKPLFPAARQTKATDFNDLAAMAGLKAVLACFSELELNNQNNERNHANIK